MTTGRSIKPACKKQLASIMEVISAAKEIMRSSGNMNQWIGGYPSEDIILNDIEKGWGFAVMDASIDGIEKLTGYFAFVPSPEPTYDAIYQGQWLDDDLPYHVIHRIASYPDSHGIFKSILDWCFTQDRNIRIDTHRDNKIMQHNILKYGFLYCGIIYLESGDERLAYQKRLNEGG